MANKLNLDTVVLKRGAHDSPADGLDIMEAVAMYAGEPHGDYPQTASRVIAAGMPGPTRLPINSPEHKK